MSATTQGVPEIPYCSVPFSYSSPVTISGTAQYIRREFFGSGAGGGLGSANPNDPNPARRASVHPIRFAEVRVTNARGFVVQCSQTASDGSFALNLPQGPETYTISVNSRSAPAPAVSSVTHLYASVLDAPSSNQIYSLTANVAAGSSQNIGVLTAAANGDLLGGAFNIFDQLLNANEYLVAQAGNCSSSFALCADYDPSLHKVNTFWKKGFNPNDYLGSGGGGLSFYLPGFSRLFILGGINGDTDHSDTDHFDNSIIIHEYGHFLEENWLKTDSPGGPHNGDEVLDPRLAWSEGWGDFIQSAVRGDNHYIDTLGNTDGVTAVLFYTNTEDGNYGSDLPNFPGEGNFREFAITRLLWDAIDDSPSETVSGINDDVHDRFKEIWATLTKSQYGFRDPSFSFLNVGLFHLAQQFLRLHPAPGDAPASDWVNIVSINRHDANESHYGQYVIPSAVVSGGGGSCASNPSIAAPSGHLYYFSLTPAHVPGDTGGLLTSDLFQNNRFYRLHINSAQAGGHHLQLLYEDDDGISKIADLDLYLYNDKARFATRSDMVTYSRIVPSGSPAEQTIQSETVTASLGVGDYLINVNVFTGSGLGSKADYNLVLDGVVLCPANLVPQ